MCHLGYVYCTINTTLVTKFWWLKNCVAKKKRVTEGLSEKFCDDSLVTQSEILSYMLSYIFSDILFLYVSCVFGFVLNRMYLELFHL